jgi:hypothetical protein
LIPFENSWIELYAKSTQAHAMGQMKEPQGIGDMQDDDVEHIHKIAA